MIVNGIKPNTIPIWKAEFLRKEHTNVVLEKIKAEIKELSPVPAAEDVIDGNEVKDAIGETLIEVNKIIDKYIEGSESE